MLKVLLLLSRHSLGIPCDTVRMHESTLRLDRCLPHRLSHLSGHLLAWSTHAESMLLLLLLQQLVPHLSLSSD